MKTSEGRAYSKGFKRDLVERIATSGLTTTEAAAKLGVPRSVLRGWMTEFKVQSKGAPPVGRADQLEQVPVIKALLALSQKSRWALFLMLLRAGPTGLPRETIKNRLCIPASSLGAHLRVLDQSGLIKVVPGSRIVGADQGNGSASYAVDIANLWRLARTIIDELRDVVVAR